MSFSVTLDGEAHNNMKKVTTWCILSKCHSGQTFVIIAIEKNPHIMASCSVMILFCCFNHTLKKKIAVLWNATLRTNTSLYTDVTFTSKYFRVFWTHASNRCPSSNHYLLLAVLFCTLPFVFCLKVNSKGVQ